jgi:hypothetical protein
MAQSSRGHRGASGYYQTYRQRILSRTHGTDTVNVEPSNHQHASRNTKLTRTVTALHCRLARDAQLAAMQLDELFDQCQTDARAFMAPTDALHAVESLANEIEV